MSRFLELIGVQRPEQPVEISPRRRIAIIATLIGIAVVVIIIRVAVS